MTSERPDGVAAGPPPADLVARAFDLGAVLGEPTFAARGELGHVWRLVTDRGTWAVKRLVQPVDETTGEDLDFQLAASAAGVRLPRPLRTTAGARALVTDKVTGEVIGSIGSQPVIARPPTCHLGWWMGPAARGKGYGATVPSVWYVLTDPV
jgi:hypothetical protein